MLNRRDIESITVALQRIDTTLQDIKGRTDKLEVILLFRDPGSPAAAGAYEGLRKQVVAALGERQAHLAQLAEVEATITRGADPAELAHLVRRWCEAAGLGVVPDAGDDEDMLFELVDDRGGAIHVLEPAYRDEVTGRVVRRGRAYRAEPEVEDHADHASSTEDPTEDPSGPTGSDMANPLSDSAAADDLVLQPPMEEAQEVPR